jgi:NTE family protein
MRYFDSRDEALRVEHVMASGALPPAFPAVLVDGEPYWDGGIHSNTPIEVVMDDNPRVNSVIFATHLWQREGAPPGSIEQVMARLKDMQFSSRAESHFQRQQQIHQLRHVVRELGGFLPDGATADPRVRELLACGCRAVMQVIPLLAPALPGEDQFKDLDFTPQGVAARWQAGLESTRRRIQAAAWTRALDPALGIVVHEE